MFSEFHFANKIQEEHAAVSKAGSGPHPIQTTVFSLGKESFFDSLFFTEDEASVGEDAFGSKENLWTSRPDGRPCMLTNYLFKDWTDSFPMFF